MLVSSASALTFLPTLLLAHLQGAEAQRWSWLSSSLASPTRASTTVPCPQVSRWPSVSGHMSFLLSLPWGPSEGRVVYAICGDPPSAHLALEGYLPS